MSQNLNTDSLNNPSTKGLVTDLAPHLQNKEIWTYARNSVLNSHAGNMYALQNEQSNFKCIDLPYTYIGSIPLNEGRFAIFTTDNTNSEIGIFDPKDCSYVKVVNDACLGFNTSYLISGKSKYNYDCSETIYWADSGLNPRRFLNLQHVPYVNIGTVCNPDYTTALDCNKILIDPNISVPLIFTEIASEGNLKNGSYQFAIAYAIKKERFTDIYSFTNAISIFSHNNLGLKGVSLKISGLDSSTFDEYELFAAITIDNYTSYKSLGFYSTSESSITITTVDRPEYTAISNEDIFVKKQVYEKADWCEGNDQYLLWGGLKAPTDIGYQIQALNIAVNYAIVEAPPNYYKLSGGKNVGYYGDEVYAFGIQWLKSNGSYTDVYHIPGTISGANYVLTPEQELDVYETGGTCENDEVPPAWYVYNTATKAGEINVPIPNDCDLTVVASGSMAYTESTLDYPNNDDMFGALKCTPIRHHKFPNELKEPRYHPTNYSLVGNPGNIRIKTALFSNIEHPKDVNGNYISGITGYRILRSDRSGNRTVLARGYSTNMGYYYEYADPENHSSQITSTIYYPNYPYNDINPDPFLGDYFYSTVTTPSASTIGTFFDDKFTFYSPHTLIGRYSLGTEVIFESDEGGTTTGNFKNVYDHPSFKLWTSGGLSEALLVSLAMTIQESMDTFFGVSSNYNGALGGPLYLVAYVINAIGNIVGRSTITGNNFIEVVNNASDWQNYVVQYDSSCLLNKEIIRTPTVGHRRFLSNYTYLGDGLNPVPNATDTYINNFKKPMGVYFELGSGITYSTYSDNSRFRFPSGDKLNKSYNASATTYYTTVKRRLPSQYGTLDSVKYVNTGYEQDITNWSGTPYVYHTPITEPVFGGDCFINIFSVNQPQPFFTNYPLGTPNGTIWDYRNYRNLAYPTYWINNQPYDIYSAIVNSLTSASAIVSWLTGNSPTATLTIFPESRFLLDNINSVILNPLEPIIKAATEDALIRNDHAVMYSSYNGSVITYVESDFNLSYRDYLAPTSNVYQINPSLNWIYRSDNLFTPEEFIYNNSYSKQNIEVYAVQQNLDFNWANAIDCAPYWVNTIAYSLPASEDQKQDHWLFYLPANVYSFPINDFGYFTSMHAIDNQQIIFFFDKAGPYVTIGRDMLETKNGISVTIGDAGLFEREPRPIEYTTYGFGSSTSRFAFRPTAYGNYYASQEAGKIFTQYGLKLKEISKDGNKYWFSEFLPSQLLKQFPTFQDKDNPVTGVGLLSIYDPTYETFVLTKKDYKCIDPEVSYISASNTFVKGEDEVFLTNPLYFEDASWTISYKADLDAYVSWHDYHPIGYLQGKQHFMSIAKNNGGTSSIWKHNEIYTSYCNFYNIDYPFSIELPVNNQTNIETIRSFEFYAETYVYKTQWDYFHVLDTTFDYAIMHNSEQISGWLHLNSIIRNQVSQQFLYPYYNNTLDQYEIKIDKVENRYRINQFWDITKDRGEYSGLQIPLILTESNGYKFEINPIGVDYAKPQTQRKKFRHKTSKVYLEKEVSGNNKITLHFSDTKQTQSPR
jgi:hypothetical protein